MRQRFWLVFSLVCGLVAQGCSKSPVQESIDYCAAQATKTLSQKDELEIPSSVPSGSSEWIYTTPGNWVCGFWPGDLWYLYEGTGDDKWRTAAQSATEQILPVAYQKAGSHDVGFMTMTSIGNAYRLTEEPKYMDALEAAADSLVTLYNPTVGTILSWPGMVAQMGWPHNTIIDNMINLELLFFVAQQTGRQDLYDIAARHAEVTMEHQFRPDHSTYHVMVFDPEDGHFIAGHTHQGWRDDSTWARGQAWAVYGFTMAYRFTRDERFLQTAQDAADYFIGRLPEDLIPYWDFDAGEQLPSQPRDASAAAITASALLELQSYVEPSKAAEYTTVAQNIIDTLSKDPYRAGAQCSAFILHCTGHMPKGSEVDASISYGDYYYLESLIRLKRYLKGDQVVD